MLELRTHGDVCRASSKRVGGPADPPSDSPTEIRKTLERKMRLTKAAGELRLNVGT